MSAGWPPRDSPREAVRLDVAGERRHGAAAGTERGGDAVVWASGSGGTVIRSADGGATWARLDVPTPKSWISATSTRWRAHRVRAQRRRRRASRIYKTTDAGLTWTLQFRNADNHAFFDAMAFRDARTRICLRRSVDGRLVILTTADGGAKWSRIKRGCHCAPQRRRVRGERHQRRHGRKPDLDRDQRLPGLPVPDNGRTWSAVDSNPVRASAGFLDRLRQRHTASSSAATTRRSGPRPTTPRSPRTAAPRGRGQGPRRIPLRRWIPRRDGRRQGSRGCRRADRLRLLERWRAGRGRPWAVPASTRCRSCAAHGRCGPQGEGGRSPGDF